MKTPPGLLGLSGKDDAFKVSENIETTLPPLERDVNCKARWPLVAEKSKDNVSAVADSKSVKSYEMKELA